MIELILTIGVVLLYMLIFKLRGSAVVTALGLKKLYIHREIVGFFAYFAVFQAVYVPMVLFYAYFHLLAYAWLLTLVIIIPVCGVYLVTSGGSHPMRMPTGGVTASDDPFLAKIASVIKVPSLLGCAGFLVFLVLQQYLGWDTAFYMGNMNEALYTDTMYLYNGNDGTLMKHIDLRYALSGFSMQFSVPCYFLHISPVIMCYYGVRGLGAILTMIIVYDFGMLLFEKKEVHACLMVVMFLVVNLLFFSHSSSSLFFIRRMYEAKGYCANVVLPAVALLLMMIYKKQGKHLWVLLFVICLGSVGASMSSMMLVPALLGLGSVIIAVSERRIRPVFYAIVCALPCLCYVALYILGENDILMFNIKG